MTLDNFFDREGEPDYNEPRESLNNCNPFHRNLGPYEIPFPHPLPKDSCKFLKDNLKTKDMLRLLKKVKTRLKSDSELSDNCRECMYFSLISIHKCAHCYTMQAYEQLSALEVLSDSWKEALRASLDNSLIAEKSLRLAQELSPYSEGFIHVKTTLNKPEVYEIPYDAAFLKVLTIRKAICNAMEYPHVFQNLLYMDERLQKAIQDNDYLLAAKIMEDIEKAKQAEFED
jgi:hypothetical protein